MGTEQEGVASGANSAFREVGGVLGIAVLGAVFSARGGYTSGAAYVAGLRPAVWVGVVVVGDLVYRGFNRVVRYRLRRSMNIRWRRVVRVRVVRVRLNR